MEEELVDADDLQPGLLTDKKHPLIESFKTEKDQLHLSSCNMNTAPVHLKNCSFIPVNLLHKWCHLKGKK